jgi:transcriptional regulator with XRE-family HTH domain
MTVGETAVLSTVDGEELGRLTARLAPVPAARLGMLLVGRREAAGLTVAEAAAAVGVRRRTYLGFERGRRLAPPQLVARLLAAFGSTLEELLPPRVSIDPDLLQADEPAAILRSYIALVRSWRGTAGGPLRFRADDVAVLVALLGREPATIERRLVELTGCDPAEASRLRRVLVASLVVLPITVGSVAGAGVAFAPSAAASSAGSAGSMAAAAVGGSAQTDSATGVAAGLPGPASTAALGAGAAAPTNPAGATMPTTLVGVLQPSLGRAAALRTVGVNTVVVSARWDKLEPSRGTVDGGYVARLRGQVQSWLTAGLLPVLDPGLQYPPAWVFDLDDSTRFVDQAGRTYLGPVGADVPDAVWNLKVRQAQQAYLARLATSLAGLKLAAVRAGGLVYGEVRLPGQGVGSNSFWAYSRAAQAASPVRGWRPGANKAKAKEFVSWYLGSVTRYERALVDAIRADFPGVGVHVMLPDWGIRPGEASAAATAGLAGNSTAERNGTLSRALDWEAQVAALPAGVTVYSTTVATADKGTGAAAESPIAYLARLAKPRGLAVAGETAGPVDAAGLQRVVARTRSLGLTAVLYMSEGALFAPAANQIGLADLAAAVPKLTKPTG